MERGAWLLAPDITYLDGKMLAITRCESAFLYVLAKAGGRPLRQVAVGLRSSLSEDVENPENAARVRACRLRHRLPQVPFETVRGRGYRWAT